MSRQLLRRLLVLPALAMVGLTAACINIFWRTEAVPKRHASITDAGQIKSPFKVHMVDGSTVVFRYGAVISGRTIVGAGEHYPLLSNSATTMVTNVVVDSTVVALESFEGKVLAAPTILVSTAATAVGVFASVLLLKALFGSCPTVYASTPLGLTLEAEGFTYAIAPLFEHRDVDRLRAKPDSDGIVRLELRNEALETHLINHIELLSVSHKTGQLLVPDQNNRMAALDDLRPLSVATDRSGRDVRALLDSSDGRLFASAEETVERAGLSDFNDWIDIETADLPAGDSVAVVLRLRNSLLNTVLLYEGMLGGPDAVDWLGTNLQQIASAVDLSRWYVRTMGMHIGAGNVTVQLRDVGPLAFRDVAVVLPRPPSSDGRGRFRLRFVADNWRIDYAAIAGSISRPAFATLPVSRVVTPTPASGGGPALDSGAVDMLAAADDRYLQTVPGQRMTLEFRKDATTVTPGMTRTYLIAWQGWYREWIRGSWVANPVRTTPFVPGDAAVVTALERWRARKVEFEKAFYATRVPVR